MSLRVSTLLLCSLVVHGKRASGSDSGAVTDLSPASFDARTASGEWLVAFTAPWCGHCKAAKPALREAAKQLRGRVSCGTVDATRHRSLAARFAISAYPTFFFISANGSGAYVQQQKAPLRLLCSSPIPEFTTLLTPPPPRRCARGADPARPLDRGARALRRSGLARRCVRISLDGARRTTEPRPVLRAAHH